MVSYDIECRPQAKQNLESLEENPRERLTDAIIEVAENRKPTNHPKCSVLSNNHTETLYKIKVGKFRAIARLEKPTLQVLKVGHRQAFYDDVDQLYAKL